MIRLLFALTLVFSGCFSFADPVTSNADKTTTATVTIANGATVSGAIDLGAFVLDGINFPAAFTGTTVTFQTAESIGGTYQPVYNAAGQVTYTVAQGRYYAIANGDFQGVRFLKVVSGSAEGAARILTLHLETTF